MEQVLTSVIDALVKTASPTTLLLVLILIGLSYVFFRLWSGFERDREALSVRISTLEERTDNLTKEYSDKIDKVQDRYQVQNERIYEVLVRLSTKLFG